MMNFVNVCKRFHDQISSEESHFEVAYFIDSTLGFLKEDHCLDKKRGFFFGAMSKAILCCSCFFREKMT